MNEHYTYSLINPQTKNLAFKIFSLKEDNSDFDHIQRLGYFSLILLEKGDGNLKVDFNEYKIEANAILSFAPYQPFMVEAKNPIKGSCILFHPEFFCIYKHMQDVACNGVLFNNIYDAPFTKLNHQQIDHLNSNALSY